jgi:hypothetical protein
MIASIKYYFTGAEADYLTDGDGNRVVDGDGNYISAGTTTVHFCPASGLKVIDVFLNGVSLEIGSECEVNEHYGSVVFNEVAERGDSAMVIYKTLPRYGNSLVIDGDFSAGDFDNSDFLV